MGLLRACGASVLGLLAVLARAEACVSGCEHVAGVWPPSGSAGGGTVVTLYGDGFFDDDEPQCVFGAAPVLAAFVLPHLVSCSTPPSAQGFVSVRLSFNGGVDVGEEPTAEFLYTEVVDVRSLTPVAGDSGGGAAVWLTGAHFSPGAECAWGTAAGGETASFVSTSLLRCEAPPLPAGAATVRARLHAESSGAGTTFAVYAPMVSKQAQPAQSPVTGGTQVLLTGEQFRDGEDVSCAFGAVRVAAAVLGAARATCVAPAHAPGYALLRMQLQAVLDTGGVDFVFTEDVRVDAMTYDVAGHVLEVQLWGAGLDTLQQPQCVLGGATALTSADAGTLRCALPAVPGAGYTTLMLSDLTLAEALQAGVVRTAAFPRSTAAQPPAGGADGGAVVSLVGVGFDGAATGNAWCVFDGARAPALFVSSALLLCEAPASRPGALALHAVSENSAVMVAAGSGAAVFWALVDPVPLSVYPDVGSLLGGTSVTVRGMGLADADGVQCRMGTVGPLPTVPVGDGALACVTPARGTGTALLVLGLNMQQYSPVSQGMPFVYAQAPQALGATPDRGPTFGRSAVDVITDSLGPSPALMLCAVGTSVTPPSAVMLVSITCPLPPGSAGFVRIAVLTTPDESSAAAGTDFLYYEPPTLRAVLPAAASTGGGTLLHVSGAHFAPLELTCALVLGSVASAAQVVSSALLLCEAAPSRSEGPLPLVVSRTGTTVPEHAELMVLYAWLPAVASAVPGAGPATGGTALTLGGQGLHSGDLLACWLGTVGPLAARGSATGSLDCVTPAHAPGAVPAFASWVGEHAPVERALYTFWSPPSLGQSAAPWPDAVPTVGGVASVLALEDVPLGVTLLTLVGRAIATLAAVSQGGVQFLVPSHAPGFVSVELSYDARSGGDGGGALWALAGDLQYVMAPRLLAMVPRLGTADGGTVLHVTGTHLCGGFAQTAVFVRGVRAPGGAFASSALFILEVPPAQAGGLTASVQLTSTATATAGGLPALTEDGAEYVYTPLAQVLLGSGPAGGGTAGGTLVTLRGAGLRDSADLRCHFGSIATTTLGMPSAQTVLCASPAASATGDRAACAVSASNNGGVDRQFSTDAAFHVFAEPVLHFVMPYDGSASGGTRVELTGTGLAQLLQGVSPLLCRFDLLAAAASVGSPTPAGATAWCIAPPHSPGFVALEVSLFGGNHSASAEVQFNFLPAPLVIRAWPAKARSDGGTLVSLRGRDLGVGAAPGADVLVRFPGKEPDDGGPPSRGRLVSSVLITVEAPPEAGGASSDATTASVDTADFAYVAAPRLLAAAPMLGSVRGGTVVSLAGVGFVAADAHVCRFGSVGPVAAEYISDSVVRCTTPAHAPGAPVLVGVARANLVDFVSALGVLFEY